MKPFSPLHNWQPHGRLLTELDLNNIIIATTQSVSDGVQFELAKIKVLIIYFLYAFLVSSLFLLSLSLTFFSLRSLRMTAGIRNHHLNCTISILHHLSLSLSKRATPNAPALKNHPKLLARHIILKPPRRTFAASYHLSNFFLFLPFTYFSNRRFTFQPLQEKDVRIILGNFGESWARKIFCEVRKDRNQKFSRSNRIARSSLFFSLLKASQNKFCSRLFCSALSFSAASGSHSS